MPSTTIVPTSKKSSTTKSSSNKKAVVPTNQNWSYEFDTLRREDLFRNPPTDRTAYPLLKNAVAPHVDSFNAIFEKDGLIAHAMQDIGTRVYLDGDDRAGPQGKNRLQVRIKETYLEKSKLPDTNKYTSIHNRKIMPAECRERHSTYRGKFTALIEYSVNDEPPKEFLQYFGQVPLMLMVCSNSFLLHI